MNENYDNQPVRRIVLPSGRSIEVVRFDEAEQPSPREAAGPSEPSDAIKPSPPGGAEPLTPRELHAEPLTPRELHACAACDSELVQPITWAEASDDSWELTLECPNCGWTAGGVYGQDQVDRFEERLDDGLAGLLDDLQRLTQANMGDEIDRFAGALQADLILPEDF